MVSGWWFVSRGASGTRFVLLKLAVVIVGALGGVWIGYRLSILSGLHMLALGAPFGGCGRGAPGEGEEEPTRLRFRACRRNEIR